MRLLLMLTAMTALAAFAAPALCATIEVDPLSIRAALERVSPGDVVLLEDGLYPGDLLLARSGSADAPITIRAAGRNAIVRGGRHGLRIEGASHILVEGIRFEDAEIAGIGVRKGDADKASHVTIRECVCANNRVWGIFTSHMDDFTVENCETFGATIEHGIYVSNSGDRPVIRGNFVHHNAGNGIHINGDPSCGGDGVISKALVENNIIYENGKARGGSALSLMHVQGSLLRNNLIFHNYAHGITLYWYTGDEATQSSRRNQVVNNTVFFRPGEGRFCLLMRRSSTDCTVRNNIFVGGARANMLIEASSLEGIALDHNVHFNYPGQRWIGDAQAASEPDEMKAEDFLDAMKKRGLVVSGENGVEVTLDSWREAGFSKDSVFGEMPRFLDASAGNLRLQPGSVGVDIGAALPDLVPVDLDDVARPQGAGWDCGCYELPAAAM